MGKGGRDWESYKMNLTLFTTKEERMGLIPILFPLKYSVVESRNCPEKETFNNNPKNLEIYIMFHSMKISNSSKFQTNDFLEFHFIFFISAGTYLGGVETI